MFALRGMPLFAATMKFTVCGPVPVAGIPVTHEGAPLLVQVHPAAVFTATELAPPPADAAWLPGAIE